jgi:hypothetical protein
VGRPVKKRALGRPRLRWEDGIIMDLREFGWECGVDLFGSGLGPVAGYCQHGDEPSGSGDTK